MASPTESEILIQDFLAQNPSLDAELGEIEVMTDRYTNAEWTKQIKETQRRVEVNKGNKYDAPTVGSKEFAETIDHTVLKLDATPAQIDALCSEARTEGFKVSVSGRTHLTWNFLFGSYNIFFLWIPCYVLLV